VLAYLRSLLRGQPEHHLGHNPAGSWAIYALLSLGMLTCLSGWLKLQDIGGDAMGAMHEGSANALLGVVLLHLLGVVASSALHRENLLRAMITGYKNGEAGEAIARAHWLIAATLAAMVVLAWAIIPW
jgi:cytochrome b